MCIRDSTNTHTQHTWYFPYHDDKTVFSVGHRWHRAGRKEIDASSMLSRTVINNTEPRTQPWGIPDSRDVYYFIIIIHRFYVALFSSLEHTHCGHVSCDSEWVTVSFYGVLTAFSGCCMAGATWNCSCLGASSVYTIQLCTSLQCHFIQSHIGRVYVYLAVTCHLRFWGNNRDLLRATAVTRKWNGYRNKKSAQKVYRGDESSPTSPAGTQTRDLSITSPTL